MRRRIFLALAITLAIITCFLLAILLGPGPRYKVKNPELYVALNPQRIAEGRRMALMICIKCHYDEHTNSLSGNTVTNPEAIGDNFASNITRDSITGIGGWTDGQLAFLLRTGIGPDGRFVFDMPKYPLLADEDLYSIIAFLKSDDSLVRPISKAVPKPRNGFLVKLFLYTIIKPCKFPEKPINEPDSAKTVAFGHYLATCKFSCVDCHSNDIIGNYHQDRPEQSNNFFGGGAPHVDSEHKQIFTANLTSDTLTGIGNWTEQDFKKALKYGIKPDGNTVRDPMFPFYLLTDREVSAIYQYLKTLKPIKSTT